MQHRGAQNLVTVASSYRKSANAFDFGSFGVSNLVTLAQSDAECATVLRFGHPDGAKRKTVAYLYTNLFFVKQ